MHRPVTEDMSEKVTLWAVIQSLKSRVSLSSQRRCFAFLVTRVCVTETARPCELEEGARSPKDFQLLGFGSSKSLAHTALLFTPAGSADLPIDAHNMCKDISSG